MSNLDQIDYKHMDPELLAKMEKWEANKPEAKTVSALTDLSDHLEQLIITMEQGQTADEDSTKQLGAILVDIRNTLADLNKKETPESPDYASPVVEAVKALETALTKALNSIDIQPQVSVQVPKIDAPRVNVSPPGVDLKGVEEAITTLSQSFKDAIALIPETPETDLSPLVMQLQMMSTQLESIDTAGRMKPQAPVRLQVTNPDGSVVGSGIGLLAKRVDTTTTANTIYVGSAPVDSSDVGPVWQMKKIDTTNGADVTWADGNTLYDNIWSNRASLSYS